MSPNSRFGQASLFVLWNLGFALGVTNVQPGHGGYQLERVSEIFTGREGKGLKGEKTSVQSLPRDGMTESVFHRLPRLLLVFNQMTNLPDKGLKIVEVRACDQVTETGTSLKALSRSMDSLMSLNLA